MPRFFRRLAEGVFDEERSRAAPDRRSSRHSSAPASSKEYEFDPSPAPSPRSGFSNGANIAANVLLLRPERAGRRGAAAPDPAVRAAGAAGARRHRRPDRRRRGRSGLAPRKGPAARGDPDRRGRRRQRPHRARRRTRPDAERPGHRRAVDGRDGRPSTPTAVSTPSDGGTRCLTAPTSTRSSSTHPRDRGRLRGVSGERRSLGPPADVPDVRQDRLL